MAHELHDILIGVVSMESENMATLAYGGGFESFLNKVVTPIYTVIHEVRYFPNVLAHSYVYL